MKTNWTKGMTEEHSVIMKREFEESKALRRRLSELIEEKISSEQRESMSKDLYSSPSWAYKQADTVGFTRALHEVLSLIAD